MRAGPACKVPVFFVKWYCTDIVDVPTWPCVAVPVRARMTDMTLTIPDFSSASVLVAGDVMLDQYWLGGTKRISPEAPVPVVHVSHDEERPGGAANVAVNLASLGSAAQLIGLAGNAQAADTLERSLAAADVDVALMRDPTLPTITKLRVLSRGQQLIRLDREERAQSALSLTAMVAERLPNSSVVVLSDYGKGALRDAPALISACRQAKVPVLVDP